MKCPKCGLSLPEDSEFCQYCGTHLEVQSSSDMSTKEAGIFMGTFPTSQISYEKLESSTGSITSTTTPEAETKASSKSNRKQAFCRKCGAVIDPTTKKCSGCGKQYFRTKTAIPPILLSILLIVSAGINVMQYQQGKVAIETTVSQETKIKELEKIVTSQKSTISSQKNTIAAQKDTIALSEKKSGYFDTICKEVSSGNLGYAANNFMASESVIVVNRNEINRKFTLTAHWTEGGTVSVEYSRDIAAVVSFDNDTWTTSTKITIEPKHEGVTAVTFSNNVNSKTFKVLIIVTS